MLGVTPDERKLLRAAAEAALKAEDALFDEVPSPTNPDYAKALKREQEAEAQFNRLVTPALITKLLDLIEAPASASAGEGE